MHLIDLKAGVTAAVPIVGSTIPIGVGLSWGIKLQRKKNIVVIFLEMVLLRRGFSRKFRFCITP